MKKRRECKKNFFFASLTLTGNIFHRDRLWEGTIFQRFLFGKPFFFLVVCICSHKLKFSLAYAILLFVVLHYFVMKCNIFARKNFDKVKFIFGNFKIYSSMFWMLYFEKSMKTYSVIAL